MFPFDDVIMYWPVADLQMCPICLARYSLSGHRKILGPSWSALDIDSIMMLMKFADLSQSDRSNWIMWQVKDLIGASVWPGKNSFHKSVEKILLYIQLHFLKSKWKYEQIKIGMDVIIVFFFIFMF